MSSRYSDFERSRRTCLNTDMESVKGVAEYPLPSLSVKCVMLKPRYSGYDNITVFYQEVDNRIAVVKSLNESVSDGNKAEEVKKTPFLQPGIVKYEGEYYNVFKQSGNLEVVKL